MADGLFDAFLTLLQWPNPLLILLAAAFGFSMGIIPGLGGALVMVLLLPLTSEMSPESAVIVLMAGYGVVGTGGMVTSIVLNTPGTPENAATTLDGYPLARAGRAPEALGAGAAASTLGALVGLVILLLVVPFARPLVLALTYPDFLMLALVGLSLIAVITKGQAYRALISAALGLLVAAVGLDPVVGRPRFTFGQIELWDGIPLVPTLIGLFAGAELLALYGAGKSIAADQDAKTRDDEIALPPGARSTFLGGFLRVARAPLGWVRGGILGTLVGVVPAVGGVVASFLSYAQAAKFSKESHLFGRGAIDGIVGAESANDAKEAGAMLPTLAFGIPGSIGTAIVLAALLFHGIPAGPSLMRDNINIIYVLLAAMIASKLLCPFFVWAIGTRVLWFSRLRIEIIVPIITVLLFAGTYAASESMFHVALVLVFGYVGYGLQAYGYSRIAFVIAFVLGPLVEGSYHQTVLTFGSIRAGLQRPVAASLLILALLTLGAPILALVRRRLRQRRTATVQVAERQSVLEPGKRPQVGPGGVAFDLLLVGVAGVLLWQTLTDVRGDAALVPLVVSVPMLVGTVLVLGLDLWAVVSRYRRGRRDTGSRPHDPWPSEADGGASERVPSAEPPPSDVVVTDAVGLATAPDRDGAPVGAAPEAHEQRNLARELRVAGWAFGLFLVAVYVGILWASVAGLLVFFLVINRERAITAVALTAGASAVLYGLFVLLLGVDL